MNPRRARVAWALGVTTVGLAFVLPVLAMISGSFRGLGLAPPRGVELIPPSASLDAYRTAFSIVPLTRSILNSLLVAAIAVPLTVLTASWAGYGISQLEPRRRRALIVGLLVVMMIPASALWIPRFAIFNSLGVTDSYVPLIAPALLGGSPVLVVLYLLAFRRVPQDLIDAARIEGAREWMVWRRIAMPLVKATTVAVALLAFALFWGNFIDPLLYLSTQERFTAPMVLRSLQQLDRSNWPVMLAGSVVVAGPVLLTFAIALRLIVPRKGTGWT